MDKGTQEEVKTAYLFDEKVKRVQHFIELRYQRLAKVKSYHKLMPLLEGKQITFLTYIKETGKRPVGPVSQYSYGTTTTESYLTETDIQRYFEWLIAVVAGTEKTSQDTIRAAYEQLFLFILILDDDIEEVEDKKAPSYASQPKLELLEKRIESVESILTKRDKEITDTLELILKWKRDSQKTLDKAKEYFDKLVRR